MILAFVIPPVLFVGGLLALLYALRGRAVDAPAAADAGDGDWFDELGGETATAADAPASVEAGDIEDVDAAAVPAGEAAEESLETCSHDAGWKRGWHDAERHRVTDRLEIREGCDLTAGMEGYVQGWNDWLDVHAPAPSPRKVVRHAVSNPPLQDSSFGQPVRRERRLNPMILERRAARDTALRAVFAAGPLTRAEAKDALRARGVGERMVKSWLESTSGRFTLPDAAGRFTLLNP